VAFAGNFAPKGWAVASGQLLPINQNQALASQIMQQTEIDVIILVNKYLF
jgi:microcystin-dependent protein